MHPVSTIYTYWGSFFLRFRFIVKVGLILVSFMLMAFGLYTPPTVMTVIVNGEEQYVVTEARTVAELLQQLEIETTYRDYIFPDPEESLTSEQVVEWRKAKLVALLDYGTIRHVWTTAPTVVQFLKEQQISLGLTGIVKPGLTSKIEHLQLIEVADLDVARMQEEIELSYETIEQEDDTLPQGRTQILQQGSMGKEIQQYWLMYKNGREISRDLIHTEIVTEPRDHIIALGTKEALMRDSYTFIPKKTLTNVTLTAYSAGPAHTGKTSDHPYYGMTRSGTRATAGRTIAVDPELIPLGTWVYIEGVGLRRAEDTGGAVVGKKLDLFFDNDDEATAFGLKRGFTVHVIGREKPKQTD